MKKYVGPVYSPLSVRSTAVDLLRLSFEVNAEDNSVTVFEDAEQIFE